MPISGDLRDGSDPGDAANERALRDGGFGAIVPDEMQNVAELMVCEEAFGQGVQLDRALGQRMIGEHRGVKVAEELPVIPNGRRWGASAPRARGR